MRAASDVPHVCALRVRVAFVDACALRATVRWGGYRYAPGVEILAAVPSADSHHYTAIMSGTSMATPLVAGVALQVWGLHPTFSPDDVVRSILCLCVQGKVTGLTSHDRDYFLQGGAQIAEPANADLIAAQAASDESSATRAPRDATQCYRPELEARDTPEDDTPVQARAQPQPHPARGRHTGGAVLVPPQAVYDV